MSKNSSNATGGTNRCTAVVINKTKTENRITSATFSDDVSQRSHANNRICNNRICRHSCHKTSYEITESKCALSMAISH